MSFESRSTPVPKTNSSSNRIGNLLAGARLKAGLTQAQRAEKLKIRQNMISDYERGRRSYSDAMARRLAKALKVKEERLRYGRGKTKRGSRGGRADEVQRKINRVKQVRRDSHRHALIPIPSRPAVLLRSPTVSTTLRALQQQHGRQCEEV